MEAKVAHLETHTKTLEAEIEALRADMVKLVHYSKSSSQDVEFRDQALKQVRSFSLQSSYNFSGLKLQKILCIREFVLL
jgi:hypothetical protein